MYGSLVYKEQFYSFQKLHGVCNLMYVTAMFIEKYDGDTFNDLLVDPPENFNNLTKIKA